jgi:hypothetical protein
MPTHERERNEAMSLARKIRDVAAGLKNAQTHAKSGNPAYASGLIDAEARKLDSLAKEVEKLEKQLEKAAKPRGGQVAP